MHGRVNYGGGTKWRWKNALNLCAGTHNASATIGCFKRKINRRISWQSAIKSCNHVSRGSGISHRPPPVRGHRPPPVRGHRPSLDQKALRQLNFRVEKKSQSKIGTIQWTIKGRGEGRVVESGGYYTVVNLVNNRGIKKQRRAFGADLGFLKPSSEGNNVKIVREKGRGLVHYGDVVALRVSGYGWLKYQPRKRGINLDAHKVKNPNSKNFIWRITGGKRGTKLLSGMPFALRQEAIVHTETVYCSRTYGINLGWYKKSKCNSRGAWVSNKLFGENGALSSDGLVGKQVKKWKKKVCKMGVDAAAVYVTAQTGATAAPLVAIAADQANKECNRF